MSETCPYCKGTGKVVASFQFRLVALRDAKGVTQLEASRNLGVSRAQLANLEIGRGGASVQFILKAAEYYNCTSDHLLGIDKGQ